MATSASSGAAYADADIRSGAMTKIQRILFALMLVVAYPVIADTAARDETMPGAAKESPQPVYRAANEARDPDVM